MAFTHLLVTGYIHQYPYPHHKALSNDIYNKLSTLCYEYINGASSTIDHNTDTDNGPKKIRVHLKKDNQEKQFSCFVGPHINNLYDNLLYSAKDKFNLSLKPTNSLNIFHKHEDDGRKSYVEDIGDLMDKLDDQKDESQYLNLYLEEEEEDDIEDEAIESIKAPLVLHQSVTNLLSSNTADAQTTNLFLKPESTATNANPTKPRISAHFRTISDSSEFSEPASPSASSSTSSSDSTSSENTINQDTMDPESVLMEYGYNIMGTIKDTFCGCIYEAQSIGSPDKTNDKWSQLTAPNPADHVVIKKVIKDRIEIDDDKSDNNIVTKEAHILHYLTVNNKAPRNNICSFVELIETQTEYYLIEEYGTTMTLSLFTSRAHQYMKEGLLLKKDWRVFIKYMYWQLIVNMYWMHYDMNCCHLGLNMDNILLTNIDFVENHENGLISIDSKRLIIKLCDFSESEVWYFNKKPKEFECIKSGMSSDSIYRSPRSFNGERFNGIKADVWSLGVILHTMFTGIPPYHYPDSSDEGFLALQNNELVKYLKSNGFAKFISKQAVQLMKGVLNVDEDKRFDTKDVLRCDWFSNYYKKMHSAIEKKSKSQKLRHVKQIDMLKNVPFYDHKQPVS